MVMELVHLMAITKMEISKNVTSKHIINPSVHRVLKTWPSGMLVLVAVTDVDVRIVDVELVDSVECAAKAADKSDSSTGADSNRLDIF